MKKKASLSIILCIAMLLQCLVLPVCATQTVPLATETVPADMDVNSQGDALTTQSSVIPFGQVCIQNGCRTISAQVPLAGSERKTDTAQAAMVFEVNTGTMIYSYNPDLKLSPGTLAKIVTALLAIELCEQDEEVTVSSRNISRLPPGSQHVDLKEAEVLTVRDLLHCLVLHSANDAAIALAEHISGNQQGFVVLMNDRVRQMGCTNTEFANIHGLDNSSHHTTARDLTKIMIEASKNEIFKELFCTGTYTVPETNRSEARKLTTQNYLIDESIVPQFYDRRVTGGLASYSEISGASVVCTTDYKGISLVCVLIGASRQFAENGWSVLSYGNFNEMIELLEFTYNNYKLNRVLYDGQAFEQFSVIGGESHVVGAPQINFDSILPSDCQMENLIRKYPSTTGVTAPISKDDKIATVELWYRNSCIGEAELFAMGDVKSAKDTGVTIQGAVVEQEKDLDGVLGFVGVMGVILLGGFAAYLGVNAYRRAKRRAQRRRRRANRRRSY